jgi:hypothetical protein
MLYLLTLASVHTSGVWSTGGLLFAMPLYYVSYGIFISRLWGWNNKSIVGFEAFTVVVMKIIIIWDVTPCSLLSCNRRFGGTYRLHLQGRRLLVLAEIISSTLKMEAICSSETSVETQQTTRRHIPEDDTLPNHGCENLKSYTTFLDHTFPSVLLIQATIKLEVTWKV